MDTQIIILAAGNAERWGGECKQLADINGIPLILRTLKQLDNWNVTVVTHRIKIRDVVPKPFCYFEPENNDKLLNTILSTECLWGERTIIMLGDVVWTNDAIQKALSSEKSLEFLASDTETFAISFNEHYHDRIRAACELIIGNGLEGTTHQLYRVLAEIPIDKEWHDRYIHHRISDKTDDIDYPEDYQKKVESGYFKDKCFEVEE